MLQSEMRNRWSTGGHQDCQDSKWNMDLAESPHLKRSRLSIATPANHHSTNQLMPSPSPSARARPSLVFSPSHARALNPSRVVPSNMYFFNGSMNPRDLPFSSSSLESMGRHPSSNYSICSRSSQNHAAPEAISGDGSSFRRSISRHQSIMNGTCSESSLHDMSQSHSYPRSVSTLESSVGLQMNEDRGERSESSQVHYDNSSRETHATDYWLRKRNHERDVSPVTVMHSIRSNTTQAAYRQRRLQRRRHLLRSRGNISASLARRVAPNLSLISQIFNSSRNIPNSANEDSQIDSEENILEELSSRLPDLHHRCATTENVCVNGDQEILLQSSSSVIHVNKNVTQVLREVNTPNPDSSSSTRRDSLPCITPLMNVVSDISAASPHVSSASSFVSNNIDRYLYGLSINRFFPPPNHSLTAVSFNPIPVSGSSIYRVPLLPVRDSITNLRPPNFLPFHGANSRTTVPPATVLQLGTSAAPPPPQTLQATVFHSILPSSTTVNRLSGVNTCSSSSIAAGLTNYRIPNPNLPSRSAPAVNVGAPNCFLFRQPQTINGATAAIPMIEANAASASRPGFSQPATVALPYDRFVGMAVRCSSNPIVSNPRTLPASQSAGELGLTSSPGSYFLTARTTYGLTPVIAANSDISSAASHIIHPSSSNAQLHAFTQPIHHSSIAPTPQFYATSDHFPASSVHPLGHHHPHTHNINQAALTANNIATMNTLYWQRQMLHQQQQQQQRQHTVSSRIAAAAAATLIAATTPVPATQVHPQVQVPPTVAATAAYRLIPVPTLTATATNLSHFQPHHRIFNITTGTTFAFPAFPTMVLPRKRGLSRHELDDLTTYRFDRNSTSTVKRSGECEQNAGSATGMDTEEKADSQVEELKCMVCLDEVEENDVMRVLRCGHEFHHKCVDKWLRSNRTCPICRRDGYTGRAQSSSEIRTAAPN